LNWFSTGPGTNDYTFGLIVPINLQEPNARVEVDANMITILVVILLLVALGALPSWPYSRSWGYYPSGGLGLVVVVLVLLLLLGRI
jgi:hypothetical protein